MKQLCFPLIPLLLALLFLAGSTPPDEVLAPGQQPQLSVGPDGRIRIAFGRSDSIFCAQSADGGATFDTPAFVGSVSAMQLGMTRGPQIASSIQYSVITAMDDSGDIHYFRQHHAREQWEYKGKVNDVGRSAPEGLMSLAADARDRFYAVWLDVREKEENQVCFSTFSGASGGWNNNRLIYVSPDGHVCECCKPSIHVNGARVAVLFRNWVAGYRDLFTLASVDGGRTFSKAVQLGWDRWKLDGCPMDGGGIAIDAKGKVHTAWRRDSMVYYCQPGSREIPVREGKIAGLATQPNSGQPILISLQDKTAVKLVDLGSKQEIPVGTGSALQTVVLNDKTAFCVWEENKTIRYRTVVLPSATATAAR